MIYKQRDCLGLSYVFGGSVWWGSCWRPRAAWRTAGMLACSQYHLTWNTSSSSCLWFFFFLSCYIISACFLSIFNVAGVVGCRCLKTWPLSSNSLFLVQSCICMNTQYYYSRRGEHTAVSGFYQFSHCKNVKTKTQGWWSPYSSPVVIHGALSFELDLPTSKPVVCLLVPLDCSTKATREAVSSHSMLGGWVWGQRDCENS